MGKRKERRLAAMSASGRRVKLDLYAEPSGEMNSKSSHDEVAGDLDQDHQAGVPTSPSSSGQNQENPLLLLGQYSDDEVDDNVNKRPKHAAVVCSSTDSDGQAEEHVDAGGDTGCSTNKDIAAGNVKNEVDQLDATSLDGKDVGESGIISGTDLGNGADSITQTCASEVSGMQIIGDATNGWKVVMHEESNRYYYWNTVTGETSWEVPDVLFHGVEATGEEKVSLVTEESMGALAHVHASVPQLNTDTIEYANVGTVDNGSGHLIAEVADYTNGCNMGKENGEVATLVYDASRTVPSYSTVEVGISYPEASAQPDFTNLSQTSSALSEPLATPREEHCLPVSYEDKDKHPITASDCHEATEAHSARLVKFCESLLQRLKTSNGSGDCLERHHWTLKHILEVEIRLSDCKALSPYGPSMLPFWWHTETQLKLLESIIDQEVSRVDKSKCYNEIEAADASSLRSNNSLESRRAELEMVQRDNKTFSGVENAYHSNIDMVKDTMKEKSNVSNNEDAVKIEKLHSGGSPQLSGSAQEAQAVEEANENPNSLLPSSKIESHAGEDVDVDMDMDVEMEVDEETPANHPSSGNLLHSECSEPPEQLFQLAPSSVDTLPAPSHELNVPPPPEEEWIPPPPPDDEVPPPPPEEPPAHSTPPPPYAETVSHFSYPEQYNLGYSVPTFEYYAPTMSEAPNTNYYAHAEASHVVEPLPPPYYEQVAASSFPEAAPDVNPVEPVVYYDAASGTASLIPVINSLETSGFYVQSGPISYDNNVSASDHTGSVVIASESTRCSLPTLKAESDLSAVACDTEKVAEQAASISVTSQGMGAVLLNGTSVDAASSATVKNQSKVRTKKRSVAVAPTLRSNKKVSSLVDKWKAAKEELHGDEDDEPEDAYEILEKKRRKEIEEWRARQIASGEAQDNANFIPLGGDWRERVKRRRAEANAESVQTPPEEVVNEKKQPDLIEISKDLPSGWQAYWDESSKEIYYGNVITSETTWTCPSSR